MPQKTNGKKIQTTVRFEISMHERINTWVNADFYHRGGANRRTMDDVVHAALNFWFDCGSPLDPIPEPERQKIASRVRREIATLAKKHDAVLVSEQKAG